MGNACATIRHALRHALSTVHQLTRGNTLDSMSLPPPPAPDAALATGDTTMFPSARRVDTSKSTVPAACACSPCMTTSFTTAISSTSPSDSSYKYLATLNGVGGGGVNGQEHHGCSQRDGWTDGRVWVRYWHKWLLPPLVRCEHVTTTENVVCIVNKDILHPSIVHKSYSSGFHHVYSLPQGDGHADHPVFHSWYGGGKNRGVLRGVIFCCLQ